MSEHPIEADRNGEVVHLRPEPGTELVAVPAPPETMPEPAVATPVIHADVTEQAGELRPVIPEHLQTVEGIKATVRLHAHRHSHRARYHGVRAPGYLAARCRGAEPPDLDVVARDGPVDHGVGSGRPGPRRPQ